MQESRFVSNVADTTARRLKSIPINLLRPSRYQVRDDAFVDKQALENLAASIRSIGLLEPPKVRVLPEDPKFFEIISGHRRIRAASEVLGWKEIECEVCENISEIGTFQYSLEDNIHRHNLSSFEEGAAFLLSERMFGLSQDQIAERFHQTRAAVQSKRQLALSASSYLKYADSSFANAFLRHVTLGHLTILSKLDPNNVKYAMKMISRGATTRHLQRFANLFNQTLEKIPEKLSVKFDATDDNIRVLSEFSHTPEVSENQLLHDIDELIGESPVTMKSRLIKLQKAVQAILTTKKSTAREFVCPSCGFRIKPVTAGEGVDKAVRVNFDS